jgi:hypothetical protein
MKPRWVVKSLSLKRTDKDLDDSFTNCCSTICANVK